MFLCVLMFNWLFFVGGCCDIVWRSACVSVYPQAVRALACYVGICRKGFSLCVIFAGCKYNIII